MKRFLQNANKDHHLMSIAAGSIAEVIYANVPCLLDSVCTCTVLCSKIVPLPLLSNLTNGIAGIIQDTVLCCASFIEHARRSHSSTWLDRPNPKLIINKIFIIEKKTYSLLHNRHYRPNTLCYIIASEL